MATVKLDMDRRDFLELVWYTQQLPNNSDPELLKLKDLLYQKLDKMVERDLYSKSKLAPTLAQREKARQEYLDRKGIPTSFRW